jgi:hypothetical protein
MEFSSLVGSDKRKRGSIFPRALSRKGCFARLTLLATSALSLVALVAWREPTSRGRLVAASQEARDNRPIVRTEMRPGVANG